VIGAIAALPGGESPSRPQNAHGILQAAAAVAAEQPVPADDRYTRALDRFVYDGDYRYGDGPLARVPFAAIPRDAASAARLLEAAIRDGRWMPENNAHPRWAPGVVEAEVARSAVQLLAMGNLDGSQRQALFGLLGSRPGARSLGEITDAAGRKGVGVALRLPDFGDELRVIIDPETSDILQSTEVMAPPPANPPRLPAGVRKPP
jgi:hypothetical protein